MQTSTPAMRCRVTKLLAVGCLLVGAVFMIKTDAVGMIAQTSLVRAGADLASRVATPVMNQWYHTTGRGRYNPRERYDRRDGGYHQRNQYNDGYTFEGEGMYNNQYGTGYTDRYSDRYASRYGQYGQGSQMGYPRYGREPVQPMERVRQNPGMQQPNRQYMDDGMRRGGMAPGMGGPGGPPPGMRPRQSPRGNRQTEMPLEYNSDRFDFRYGTGRTDRHKRDGFTGDGEGLPRYSGDNRYGTGYTDRYGDRYGRNVGQYGQAIGGYARPRAPPGYPPEQPERMPPNPAQFDREQPPEGMQQNPPFGDGVHRGAQEELQADQAYSQPPGPGPAQPGGPPPAEDKPRPMSYEEYRQTYNQNAPAGSPISSR